jgi:uncharacterized damage-inducible protein DinB
VLPSTVHAVLRRELAALRRAVEIYPDDASLWAQPAGLPNSGGTLVLHLAGNLQHFLGAVLGGSGYRRDRDAEFARRGVPRSELLAEIAAAESAVDRGMATVSEAALAAPYPEIVAGRSIATGDFLVHLATHLAYHLGQFDYHRRVVSGDSRGIDAIRPGELPQR